METERARVEEDEGKLAVLFDGGGREQGGVVSGNG